MNQVQDDTDGRMFSPANVLILGREQGGQRVGFFSRKMKGESVEGVDSVCESLSWGRGAVMRTGEG